VGSQYISGFAGRPDEADAYDAMKRQVTETLRMQFRPEFLNRIDEVIVFHALTEAELTRIVDLLISDLQGRLVAQDLVLELTPAARALIAREGTDLAYGARPLKRTIQRLVENPFARALVAGEFKPGDRIVADADPVSGTLVFTSEQATVVADASDRRDARAASDGEGGQGDVGTAAGRGRRSPLDLPPVTPKPDGGKLPN
jgi:ATP-dependent Clp protease ATP-binding subunit ClpC